MSICVCCKNEFDPPEQQETCQTCWWSGQYLETKMAGLLGVLGAATGIPWRAEHTGGGCFWLICYLDGEPDQEKFDSDDLGPAFILTGEEVLAGSSTVREIEDYPWEIAPWHLGFAMNATAFSEGVDYEHWFLHTEALPMKVRERTLEMSR